MTEKPRRRKIHVELPEEIHRKLRVKAALEDLSIQAFVTSVVTQAVREVELPYVATKTGRTQPGKSQGRRQGLWVR
jgi:plasmid stability protein